MSKIYDCFNFYNELDILEIRLNTLYDYVDYFVIVESDLTHSGVIKPFYFEENKERFKKFLDKIINFKITDNPTDFVNLQTTSDSELNKIYDFIKLQNNRFNRLTQPDYGRDFFQKESVRRALINCQDDDIIFFSDADEIPNPKIIVNISELDLENNRYSLNQITYYYYLNLLKQTDWYGTKITKYKNIKNISLNELRGDENLSIKIPNGGWHFSFQGNKEMIINKLLNYSARDLASTHVLQSIESNIYNNIDPFFRSRLTLVEIDESFPEYVQKNVSKLKNMIK
jgi:beta-1,4-mannosyl-glycoprotein beta-1,4-N-acetylglucosaminyltransferase